MIENVSWALPAALEAYKSRAEIASAWDRIMALLRGRRTRVIFTGMPGVGKTVLFDHLTGRAFQSGYRPPPPSQRKEAGTLMVERKRMAFSVVPGDPSAPRYEALDDLFEGNKPVDGVVHVVANGFVEVRSEAARQVLIEDEKLETIQAFREQQRRREVEDLRETCEVLRRSLRKHRRPQWLVVAATKADLYYDEVQEVSRYYAPGSPGAFTDILGTLSAQVGTDNFRWTAAPVCAWLENFEWNGAVQPSTLSVPQRDYYLAQITRLLESYCGD